jgi:hypothetical protein
VTSVKIVFFKNESHFYPRLSYAWENAAQIHLNSKLQGMKSLFRWVLIIPYIIFLIINLRELINEPFLLIAIFLLCLPIHELCHAFFCWMSGRKVERINFFPYKQIFSNIAAYVKPAFGVWNKWQTILLSVFPIIILSILPAILSIFIPSIRLWLLLIALLNISTSSSDIINILCILKLPSDSLWFVDFMLTVRDIEKPVIIHKLFVTPELDKINHICFEYCNGKLTKMEHHTETDTTISLKKEFAAQFNKEFDTE